LQYVAVCCSMLQYVAVCCSMLQYVAVCCLPCVAVCFRVVLCVAVCCHGTPLRADRTASLVSQHTKHPLEIWHFGATTHVECCSVLAPPRYVLGMQRGLSLSIASIGSRLCTSAPRRTQCVAVHCSALQCIESRCRALQSVAERCRALQSFAVPSLTYWAYCVASRATHQASAQDCALKRVSQQSAPQSSSYSVAVCCSVSWYSLEYSAFSIAN